MLGKNIVILGEKKDQRSLCQGAKAVDRNHGLTGEAIHSCSVEHQFSHYSCLSQMHAGYEAAVILSPTDGKLCK